jgi:nitroreductase
VKVRDLLHVPQEYTLVALVACGYPDEEPESQKKPVKDVVFWNRYKE